MIELAQGDCYQANGTLFIDMCRKDKKDILLVHGDVGDTQHGHCWVESKNFCFDNSNGNEVILPIDTYYRLGQIREEACMKYKFNFARKLMLDIGHWGPWSQKEKQQVSDMHKYNRNCSECRYYQESSSSGLRECFLETQRIECDFEPELKEDY